MRFALFAMAVLLGACAFTSETPLFDARDAAFPIAEGARFDWIEPFTGGERFDVTFHRVEGGYTMTEANDPDEAVPLRFVAIADTLEDDYVAQIKLEPDEESYAYAFLWRAGGIYRIVSDPGTVDPGPKPVQDAQRNCDWQAYRECRFASADAVMAFYRASIYPRFVAGDDLPGRYTELVPHEMRLPPGPVK